jgi:hypothetical protein
MKIQKTIGRRTTAKKGQEVDLNSHQPDIEIA